MTDTAPTYRGFRNQCLYILWRILSDSDNNLIYQPEYVNDLSIWRSIGNSQNPLDASLQLIEIVEVKDRSTEIQLSDFSDSFFQRTCKELQSNKIAIRLVGYGNFGSELKKAFDVCEKEAQKTIITKLQKRCNCNIPLQDILNFVDSTTLCKVSEDSITSDLLRKLSQSPTSPDNKNAFNILIKWIYDCCEAKTKIRKSDIDKKINAIGKFVSHRAAHALEWGVALVPMDQNLSRDESNRKLLQEEFFEGIDASLAHIQNDCDVLRPDLLNQIEQKFKDRNILVIHGASGQGKSTLAYRYIYEYHPLSLCYEIKNIADSNQALRIASAISGYSQEFGKLLIYLDVKPEFTGWKYLCNEVQQYPNIKLLVTVREEDWARENISEATVKYEDIALEFLRIEAEQIFNSFPTQKLAGDIVSFDDAWQKFGQSGPLLEFVHLITHGGMLENRLTSQINKIAQQNRVKELHLLRIVSLVSAWGGTCNRISLLKYLDIDISGISIKTLNDEYLIKITENYIDGLHSIRSAKIVEILCPNEEIIFETVKEATQFVRDYNLFFFLLNAFFKCLNYKNDLLTLIYQHNVKTWTEAQNILDSLVWFGIKDYADENKTLIDKIHYELKLDPLIILDFDIAQDKPCRIGLEYAKKFCTEKVEQFQNLANRQTNKQAVFKYAHIWFTRQHFHYEITKDEEFSCIGKICFIAARAKICVKLPTSLIDSFKNKVQLIPLNTIADFIVGLYHMDETIFNSLKHLRKIINSRFKKETFTITLEENTDFIDIKFIIPFDDCIHGKAKQQEKTHFPNEVIDQKENSDSFTPLDLNDEAVGRINLLRRLYPEKKVFKSCGFGQNILFLHSDMKIPNQTIKAIDVDSIYIDWAVSLNSTLRCLSEFYYRSQSWSDFARLVISQRKEILSDLKNISEMAMQCLSNKYFNSWIGDFAKGHMPNNYIIQYPFPKCAVSQWGFDSETSAGFSSSSSSLFPIKYKLLKKTYSQYINSWYSFITQFEDGFLLSGFTKSAGVCNNTGINTKIENARRNANLSLINLKDFLKNLQSFQDAFSNLFQIRFNLNELSDLTSEEQKATALLFGMWNMMIYTPKRTTARPIEYAGNWGVCVDKILCELSKHLKGISTKQTKCYILNENVPTRLKTTLWIFIDSIDFGELFLKLGEVILFTQKNINEHTPSRKFLLEIIYEQICFIPLYKSTTIMAWAQECSITSFVTGEIENLAGWMTIYSKKISWDVVDELGIKKCDSPLMQWAHDFNDANSLLWAALTHLADINILTANIDIDSEILTLTEQYCCNLFSQRDILQKVLDTGFTLVNYCNSINITDDNENKYKSLLIVMASLKSWYDTGIVPYSPKNGIKKTSLNEISEWASKYREPSNLAASAVLLFVCHAIEQQNI